MRQIFPLKSVLVLILGPELELRGHQLQLDVRPLPLRDGAPWREQVDS